MRDRKRRIFKIDIAYDVFVLVNRFERLVLCEHFFKAYSALRRVRTIHAKWLWGEGKDAYRALLRLFKRNGQVNTIRLAWNKSLVFYAQYRSNLNAQTRAPFLFEPLYDSVQSGMRTFKGLPGPCGDTRVRFDETLHSALKIHLFALDVEKIKPTFSFERVELLCCNIRNFSLKKGKGSIARERIMAIKTFDDFAFDAQKGEKRGRQGARKACVDGGNSARKIACPFFLRMSSGNGVLSNAKSS